MQPNDPNKKLLEEIKLADEEMFFMLELMRALGANRVDQWSRIRVGILDKDILVHVFDANNGKHMVTLSGKKDVFPGGELLGKLQLLLHG